MTYIFYIKGKTLENNILHMWQFLGMNPLSKRREGTKVQKKYWYTEYLNYFSIDMYWKIDIFDNTTRDALIHISVAIPISDHLEWHLPIQIPIFWFYLSADADYWP